MNKLKALSIILIAVASVPASYAMDINSRMIPHELNNDITHMRLNAMMSKEKTAQKDRLGKHTIGSAFNDDCSMSIGAPPVNGWLHQKPQPIVITGPVINKCR